MENYPKYTKKEVDYGLSSSPAEHRCGICEYHYHPSPTGEGKMMCQVVEGTVQEMDGCKEFRRDLIEAATDPITIACYPPKKDSKQVPQ